MEEIIRKLRRYGGSLMLPLPPHILEVLGATEGTEMSLVLDGNHRLIVAPLRKKRYSLMELLAQCEGVQTAEPEDAGDHEWLTSPPTDTDHP
jgi:antitoxin ChpS